MFIVVLKLNEWGREMAGRGLSQEDLALCLDILKDASALDLTEENFTHPDEGAYEARERLVRTLETTMQMDGLTLGEGWAEALTLAVKLDETAQGNQLAQTWSVAYAALHNAILQRDGAAGIAPQTALDLSPAHRLTWSEQVDHYNPHEVNETKLADIERELGGGVFDFDG